MRAKPIVSRAQGAPPVHLIGAVLMNSPGFRVCTLVVASLIALPATGFAACDARSGPRTAALVELYTSEGCSSCPPADRQLSRLRKTLDSAAEVVPLALHVDYWDYIGWKDAYAQGAFGVRQSWLVHANQQSIVYTPEFFVGGTELRSWQGALRDRVRQINMSPAAASIRVHAGPVVSGALALSAEATTSPAGPPAALYLAVTESGLVTKVTRGENGGATLEQDYVVRNWLGPVKLRDGAASMQRDIALPAAWNRRKLNIVAFVQEEHSGKVLQALVARKCAGP